MLTASQLLDQLAAMVMEGQPAPPGILVSVTERPGQEPNWVADVTMPLPLAMAGRWVGVVAQLQWNSPRIDFSDATEDHGGARGLTQDMSAIDRGEQDATDRARTLAAALPGDSIGKDLKVRFGWIVGVPLALAIAVAAFFAMAE